MTDNNKSSEFNKIYENQVLPILEELEEKRKREAIKAHLKCLCALIFALISGLIAVFMLVLGAKIIMILMAGMILIFISGIIGSVIFISACNNYKRRLKKEIVPYLLKTFGNIERVETKDGFKRIANSTSSIFTTEELSESKLFYDFNALFADDEFVGKYKEIPFKMSEARQHFHNGRAQSYIYPVFKGLILSFDFNKKAEEKIILKTKNSSRIQDSVALNTFLSSFIICASSFIVAAIFISLNGIVFTCLSICLFAFGVWSIGVSIYKAFVGLSNEAKIHKITISDNVEIYSFDGKINSKIINSSLVKRFCTLKIPFEAESIKLSRYENKLVIAIDTEENLFEVGNLFHPLTDPKPIEIFYNEINSIYEMLEYLKIEELQ